ncbi:spermatogenesis-associated protein 1 isoform X2 [Emydura macquarii macquarii]|uniref:spermatogenesis-associated protein 1 isoform X2 n=1 Tax=Emydura macquarii macquarii TaxID=1129001 RepID=UPI00352B82DE
MNMSFSQTRPPTSELVELHVFYVPEEVWNFKLNTVSADLTSKFISAGFIRVSPHVTLRALREQLGDFLGENAVADKFIFLKNIGKKLAVVKAKQEKELKLKLFAPPHALHPELYLLPGMDHLEIVYSSSATPDTQYFNADHAESYRFPHGPSTLNLSEKEPENSPTFLESPQKNTLRQNQEDCSSLGWNETEKEIIPVLHIKHEQSLNNRTQEKQIPCRRKEGTNTLTWSQKNKGTISNLHAKQSIEQAKNEAQENHIPHGRKEIRIVRSATMDNSGNQKDIRMGRNTTGHSGIPESLGDGDMEYLHNKKSHLQSGIRESVTDIGVKQDNKTDTNDINHLKSSSQYISPPAPPLLALSINRAQVPIFQTDKSNMVEQLKQMKAERRHMERTREELVKKAKGLLEQNKLRRYHVYINLIKNNQSCYYPV